MRSYTERELLSSDWFRLACSDVDATRETAINKSKRQKQNKRKEITTELYISSRWNSCRTRARKKRVSFDLTKENIASLVYDKCIYCGASGISQIDRKNPELGYIIDNVVPACRRCNTLKNREVTFNEMIWIAKFLGWKK